MRIAIIRAGPEGPAFSFIGVVPIPHLSVLILQGSLGDEELMVWVIAINRRPCRTGKRFLF